MATEQDYIRATEQDYIRVRIEQCRIEQLRLQHFDAKLCEALVLLLERIERIEQQLHDIGARP